MNEEPINGTYLDNSIRVQVTGTTSSTAECVFAGALSQGNVLALDEFIRACEHIRSLMTTYSLKSFRFSAVFMNDDNSTLLEFTVNRYCPIRNALLNATVEAIEASEKNEWASMEDIPFLNRLREAIGEPEKVRVSAKVNIVNSPFTMKSDGKDIPLADIGMIIDKAKKLINDGIATAVRFTLTLTADAFGFRCVTRDVDAVIDKDSTIGSIVEQAITDTESEIAYEMDARDEGADSAIARLTLEKAILGWLRESV